MYKLRIVVWEITLKCNIHCLHCGSNADIHKRPKELTTSEALDLIEQLSDLNCGRIVLSGGEPFLRKDWAVLAMRIRDLGMGVSFISNGFVVNEDIVDILKVIEPLGISFSLDGGCEETHDYIRGKKGVFKRCVNALSLTSKAGLYSSAITSVHKKNINELDDILKILLDNGVRAWQIQTANPQGRMPRELTMNEDEYYKLAQFIVKARKEYGNLIRILPADCIGYYSTLDKYFERSAWKGCPAGISLIGIESDGAIKGCLSLHDEDFIEGNIRKQSLKEIWESKDKFKYNRRFSPKQLQGICKNCKYGSVCRGGCSEKSLSFTGTRYGSPYCLYNYEQKHKELIL